MAQQAQPEPLNRAGRRRGGQRAKGSRRPTPANSILIPVSESADVVGAPETSWRTVIRNEQIPIYRIGKRQYLRRKDLEGYIERQRECVA